MTKGRVLNGASFLGAWGLLAAAVGASVASCGSSGSSSTGTTDYVGLCNQVCDKELSCMPDAGALGATIAAACKQSCAMTTAKTMTAACTNQSAIASAVQACLSLSCAQIASCVVPPCQGGGGTGGTMVTTGTGGVTGSLDGTSGGGLGGASGGSLGGSSGGGGLGGASGSGLGGSSGGDGLGGAPGTAGCAACDKASACCFAIATAQAQPTASCSAYSASFCNSLTGTTQTQFATSCTGLTSEGAAMGLSACQ